ncbi:MAG: hypothetical protein F4X65_15315 [Chloroflexi bacterium]|nr:hypothetical protein [Chloroflexota bacterium]
MAYSNAELESLRTAIVNLRRHDDTQRGTIADAVASGKCPSHLAPFYPVAESCPGLFQRLTSDPLLRRYGFYALFPQLYTRIYGEGKRPRVAFDGRTRGRLAIFRFDEEPGIVVKPWQNGREDAIAKLAEDGGAGPQQLPSLEGYLVEKLLPGDFFTDLPLESLAGDTLFRVGQRVGAILASLHSRMICYNDTTLSDPDGRAHLFIDFQDSGKEISEPGCRLIDFGVSVLLDRFPDLEFEEVYNLVRTTPEFRLLSRMGLGPQEMGQFLAQYRHRLRAVSPEEILGRDLRIAEEGLRLVARRVGDTGTAALKEGIASGYGNVL